MHDEIILEVPDGLAGEVAVILKDAVFQAGQAYLGKVPFEEEVAIWDTRAEKWIA